MAQKKNQIGENGGERKKNPSANPGPVSHSPVLSYISHYLIPNPYLINFIMTQFDQNFDFKININQHDLFHGLVILHNIS